MADAVERATAALAEAFGVEPDLVVAAPGRVNLLGEHTDYNDGLVLPLALPHVTAIAAARRPDGRAEFVSEGFGRGVLDLPDGAAEAGDWLVYPRGMMARTEPARPDGWVAGYVAAVATDIPTGASLSSSAAFEVAMGVLLAALDGVEPDRAAIARRGQAVENDDLGLPSGLMDQLASAFGVDGRAILIDCRTDEVTPVEMPDDWTVVVLDTGTRRELADSEYAARRADCEAACELLGVASLRDVGLDQLEALAEHPRLLRRARHVVAENDRVLQLVEALRAADAEAAGRLLAEGHRSISEDYEVSGPALDRMVEVAAAAPGCIGARMTGGGFAGGCVALVHADRLAAFLEAVESGFEAPPEQPSTKPVRLHPLRPGPGARVVPT